MDPFADPSDIEDIWHSPLTDSEMRVVTARLAAASRMVRRNYPTIDARIAAGTITKDDVRDVVAEMVLRVVALPSYVKQESVTVDDGSKSRTYAGAVTEGVMYIADEERRTLAGASSKSRAFTIYPGAGQRWTC